jgi:hypothetical protein
MDQPLSHQRRCYEHQWYPRGFCMGYICWLDFFHRRHYRLNRSIPWGSDRRFRLRNQFRLHQLRCSDYVAGYFQYRVDQQSRRHLFQRLDAPAFAEQAISNPVCIEQFRFLRLTANNTHGRTVARTWQCAIDSSWLAQYFRANSRYASDRKHNTRYHKSGPWEASLANYNSWRSRRHCDRALCPRTLKTTAWRKRGGCRIRHIAYLVGHYCILQTVSDGRPSSTQSTERFAKRYAGGYGQVAVLPSQTCRMRGIRPTNQTFTRGWASNSKPDLVLKIQEP